MFMDVYAECINSKTQMLSTESYISQGFHDTYTTVSSAMMETVARMRTGYWHGILKAAANAGVEWYIVEQDICRCDLFESLKISLENLREMGVN